MLKVLPTHLTAQGNGDFPSFADMFDHFKASASIIQWSEECLYEHGDVPEILLGMFSVSTAFTIHPHLIARHWEAVPQIRPYHRNLWTAKYEEPDKVSLEQYIQLSKAMVEAVLRLDDRYLRFNMLERLAKATPGIVVYKATGGNAADTILGEDHGDYRASFYDNDRADTDSHTILFIWPGSPTYSPEDINQAYCDMQYGD